MLRHRECSVMVGAVALNAGNRRRNSGITGFAGVFRRINRH